jgi:hypothetical protein
MKNRLAIVGVLVAFVAAQAAVLSHRVEHAVEEQSARAGADCSHREAADHVCDRSGAAAHPADCVLCAAASFLRLDAPGGAAVSAPPVTFRAAPAVRCDPAVEPVISFPAPRGPPLA